MSRISAGGAAFVGLAMALSTAARGAGGNVDLMDVFRLSLSNDPQYQAATAVNRAAQERRPQALAGLLPALSASARTRGHEADVRESSRSGILIGSGTGRRRFNTHGITLTVRQPIYRLDRYRRLAQADALVERSDVELASALQALMTRVADRYFAVLRASDELEFARAEKEANEQQLDQARQRFEVGLVANTDVQEAKAGFDLAVAAEIAALNELDNAVEQLREITGRYHESLAPLGEEMPLVSPDPADIDAWTQTALNQNLSLTAARYTVEAAMTDIRIQEAGHVPTLDAVGTHDRSFSNGDISGGSGSAIWETTVGLELNVPIYVGGSVLSRTREARHLHRQALDELEGARRAAQRQTRESYLGVISGISRVQALNQALVSTQAAVEAVQAGFQVGTRTSVDVLQAQRNLFEARLNYASARYDYILNVLRLKQAAGTLSEDDLVEVTAWLK